MESIIAEMFYGNITPSERSYRRTGEYAHILQLVARNEEKLTETLTEAQKETFEKFKDGTSELNGMTVKELMAWHKQSNLPLKKFFNTSGLQYKTNY